MFLDFDSMSICLIPPTPTAAPSVNPTAPTVVSGAGDITAIVNQYRAVLGDPNNGGAPGAHSTGRREINWDGVPDEEPPAPNFLPADFFNAATKPRARGAMLDSRNRRAGQCGQRQSDEDRGALRPPQLHLQRDLQDLQRGAVVLPGR